MKINAKVKSGNGDTKVTATQKADSRSRKTPELSRNLIQTSLVDGHPLADLIRADHQPDIDIEKVLKPGKKKKRRKGLRP